MSDLSLLRDFITETGEHIEEIESNLLKLEAHPDDRRILNDIFRSMHTIKGSAEYLGMTGIATLSHKLENLLDLLRQGQRTVSREIIDTLIASNDRIGLLIEDLEKERAESTEVDDLLVVVDQVVNGDAPAQPPAPPGIDPEQKAALDAQAAPAVYEEDYDEELFGIFSDQLVERIQAIEALVSEMVQAEEGGQRLSECVDHLNALASSANYMGYDDLAGLYEQCVEDFEALMDSVARGEAVQYDVFAAERVIPVLGRIRQFFPQIEALQETAGSIQRAIDLKPEVDPESHAMPEEGQPFQPKDLLQKLSEAFDAKMASGSRSDNLAVTADMEAGLFSVEDLPFIPVESDMPADDTLQAALGTSLETDAPQDKVDERDGVEAQLFSQPIQRHRQPPAADRQTLSAPQNKSAKRVPLPRVPEPIKSDKLNLPDIPGTSDRRKTENMGRRSSDKVREKLLKHSIRVDADKIDTLMNNVGELVISRAWFSQVLNDMTEFQQYLQLYVKLDPKELKRIKGLTFRLSEATVSLGRVTNELQEGVMKVRMLPIAQLFSRYPRLIHDLVRDTGKKVDLAIKGETTELDKMVIEEISDPLIHIIRNAVDHGIETMDERRALGKPETGTIKLQAYHESNHVVIEISDDGKGIDVERIKRQALEKKVVTLQELERMTDREITWLIMRPGFSTSSQVTHTSGRGVGMDVVKKNIEKLNGTLEIDSSLGQGTRLRVKIPLTLAIIPALLVRVAGELFTIPLATVEETIRVFDHEIDTIEGAEVVQLRDETLPLIRLADVFNMSDTHPSPDKLFVVVVHTGVKRAGLVVDALIGQEEVVIKPLEDYLQEYSGFSGATILGDGKISLIIDSYELVKISTEKQAKKKLAAAPL